MQFFAVWTSEHAKLWNLETQRPNEVYVRLHNSPSVMYRRTTSKNEVIRPYFFENEHVTGSTYKRMVCSFLFPIIQRCPEGMIFQQNVAFPDYSSEGRDYLYRLLLNRWMGRGGPIEWPSRSPDLTPCNYLL